MENNELGKFLIELRKEKNLTQYDVADMIPISREAVSKWKRGLTKPNKSSLEKLSQIYNVSVEELLLGKRLNKSKKKEIQKLTLELYGKRIILQRIIKVLILIMLLMLLLFLSYYFINSYNSIKVYTLNTDKNDIVITDGIFVVTKKNIYFNLGNIHTDKTIINLKLYYKENDNNNLIISIDDTIINLYDYYGYNAYFDFNKINYILKNLYLDVKYDDNEIDTIKLEFVKDFANDQIFNEVNLNISNDTYEVNDNNNNTTISKIKETFEYQDGVYTSSNQDDSLTFLYIEEANLLNLTIIKNENIKEWNFYLLYDQLDFNEYQKNELINSFNYKNNVITCNIENCTKNKEEIDFFNSELNNILE